jgi:hypothetical protein
MSLFWHNFPESPPAIGWLTGLYMWEQWFFGKKQLSLFGKGIFSKLKMRLGWKSTKKCREQILPKHKLFPVSNWLSTYWLRWETGNKSVFWMGIIEGYWVIWVLGYCRRLLGDLGIGLLG